MNKKVLSDLENIPLLRREANINLWRHGLFFVAVLIASIFSNIFFSFIGLYFIGEISFFFTSIYPSFNWILSWIVAFFISIGFVLLSSEFIVQFINEATLSFFNQKNDFLEGFLNFKKINFTSEQLSVFIAILLAYIIFLLVLFFRVSRKRGILFLLDNGQFSTKNPSNVDQTFKANQSVKSKSTSNVDQTLKGKQSVKSKITSNVDQILNEGLNLFQKAASEVPSNPEEGKLKEESINDLQKVIDYLTCVIDIEPNSIKAYEFRGYSYFCLKMYDESIRDFTYILEKFRASESMEINENIFLFRAQGFIRRKNIKVVLMLLMN